MRALLLNGSCSKVEYFGDEGREIGPMDDQPLEVEVIAHVLGSMDHCSHCQVFLDGVGIGGKIHQSDLESYPTEWMDEWKRLSEVILNLTEAFAGELIVRVTDAQSPQAMWAAIRKGVRKYPTFIVAGEKYTGTDEGRARGLISRHLASRSTSQPGAG